MDSKQEHWKQSVMTVARRDFAVLQEAITALHALKLDPKIAAGPVTLAFTDIFTLFFYFSVAAILLR